MAKKYSVLLLATLGLGAMQPDRQIMDTSPSSYTAHDISAELPAATISLPMQRNAQELTTEVPVAKSMSITYKCTHPGCIYESHNEEDLLRHQVYQHSTERPFKCSYEGCSYAAKTKFSLQSHIRDRHCTEKPFKCSFQGCTYACKQKGALASHMISHQDIRPFQCLHCAYTAKRKKTLNDHMLRHHPDVVAVIEPVVSLALPPSTQDLHQETPAISQELIQKTDPVDSTPTHDEQESLAQEREAAESLLSLLSASPDRTSSKEYPSKTQFYACPVCDYIAPLSQVIIHIECKHAAKKTFTCSLCKFKSSWPYSLKVHMLCVHNQAEPIPSLQTKTDPAMLLPAPALEKSIPTEMTDVHPKKFKCPYCEHTANDKPNITKHIKYKHAEVKKYACSVCDFTCKWPQTLRLHMLRMHNQTETEET